MSDNEFCVVLDTGSATCRAGFAGDEKPLVTFPTVVGRPKMDCVGLKDMFIGDDARDRSGILRIKYPVEFKIVTNWDDMEKVWAHAFNLLGAGEMEDHPALMTIAHQTPKANRERMMVIMFEHFEVPALQIRDTGPLSLFAAGLSTGVAVDSGEQMTHITPVYEGCPMPWCSTRIDLGGMDLTYHLIDLLAKKGWSCAVRREHRLFQAIKEEMCYVAMDREVEAARPAASLNADYELPDGQRLTLGEGRFVCPEAIFQPEELGIARSGVPNFVYDAIMRCDIDLREDMFSNVALAGGNSMFRGLADRMEKELLKLAPTKQRVKVLAPPGRRDAAWAGGSIVAALPSAQPMWIPREEYEEVGPGLVHRKCF